MEEMAFRLSMTNDSDNSGHGVGGRGRNLLRLYLHEQITPPEPGNSNDHSNKADVIPKAAEDIMILKKILEYQLPEWHSTI